MSETMALPELNPVQPDMEVPLEVYGGQEYLQLLAKKIQQTVPGDRVAVLTMSLEADEPLAAEVMRELNAAAERNVDVLFAVDAYTLLINSGTYSFSNSLIPIGIRQGVFKQRQAALEELDTHPASTVAVTNMPSSLGKNPYAGRSHIKGAVVNNWLAFGGPNLHHTERIDAVVATEHSTTADWFYQVAATIAAEKDTKALGSTDISYQLDGHTDILLDVGVPGQSAIYERQLDIVRSAKENVFFTSQFVPNGAIADTLAQAHEADANVVTLFNNPAYWGAIGSLIQRAVLRKQMRTKPPKIFDGILPRNLAMHAKVLTNEAEGSVGTHNTSAAGVKFGTPEITLFRRNPAFAALLREVVLEQIPDSTLY